MYIIKPFKNKIQVHLEEKSNLKIVEYKYNTSEFKSQLRGAILN